MELLWWQLCIVTLCKGLSWAMPIFTFFLGAAWLINYVTADVAEKVKKKLPQRD